jgi:NAD(P)-dependent dehydrogenase (short-subunit alcohol dehydrogenase family)
VITRLKGRRAIVTGAASGIGRATAIRFVEEGAHVALLDRDPAGLDETRALLGAEATVITEVVDLADAAALAAFADRAVADLGGLDIVVNNAGMMMPVLLDDLTVERWDAVMDVNVTSHMLLAQAVLPALRASDAASIVTVSSISAHHAFPGMPAYAASKAAAVGLVRALAVDLADDGIRVNAILPGTVDTGMPKVILESFPEEERAAIEPTFYARQLQKRYAAPSEIAAVAAFLASDDASFMTGAIIPVDGGYSAW